MVAVEWFTMGTKAKAFHGFENRVSREKGGAGAERERKEIV